MAKSTLKRRADGRYRKIYTDKKGNTIAIYGKSEREVFDKLLAYQRKEDEGRTFREVAEEWEKESFPNLAAQTLKGYIPALARANEEFGDIPIKNITPRECYKYLSALSNSGYTSKTIANYRIVLNQVLTLAVAEGDLMYNVLSSVKNPKAKQSRTINPASTNEEEKILNSDHPWLFPVAALLTGLRKGELLALTWADIDFTAKEIRVTKSVQHVNNKPSIKSTKTESGERTVPLLDILAERMSPHIGKPEEYIFSTDGGKSPLTSSRFDKLYKDYKREVNIECNPHQLRHSFATNAIEIGVNPKFLQSTLGHADFSTTMNTYASARREAQRIVAAQFNEHYKSGKK